MKYLPGAAILILFFAAMPRVALTEPPKRIVPKGVRIETDVAYLPAERAEKADLYVPTLRAKDTRSPAVLIVHGGSWIEGDKAGGFAFDLGVNLAQRGYVGMSINYALATREKAIWPQNLYDCKTAVRWLRHNAERLQIDPRHIGAVGGSAGGHLVAMLAVTGPNDRLDPKGPYGEHSCRVQCAVDFYAPTDLTRLGYVWMLGKTRDEAPERYRAASPMPYVDKSDPPMLILHGNADKIVPVKDSELLAAALERVGVERELVIIEGADHGFNLEPKQRDLRPLVIGFFDKHLEPRK